MKVWICILFSAVKPRTPGEGEAKPIPATTRKSIPGSSSSSGITAQKRKETIPINPGIPQPAYTCSKLTIETLEQGVKFFQSYL